MPTPHGPASAETFTTATVTVQIFQQSPTNGSTPTCVAKARWASGIRNMPSSWKVTLHPSWDSSTTDSLVGGTQAGEVGEAATNSVSRTEKLIPSGRKAAIFFPESIHKTQ